MTKSHTIVITFLLITITSVGVVRCKRFKSGIWHTKGWNGKLEWSCGWDLRNIRSFNAGLKDILGTHRSTDWDNAIYRYTYTL
jgi:hypothetical protein